MYSDNYNINASGMLWNRQIAEKIGCLEYGLDEANRMNGGAAKGDGV